MTSSECCDDVDLGCELDDPDDDDGVGGEKAVKKRENH